MHAIANEHSSTVFYDEHYLHPPFPSPTPTPRPHAVARVAFQQTSTRFVLDVDSLMPKTTRQGAFDCLCRL